MACRKTAVTPLDKVRTGQNGSFFAGSTVYYNGFGQLKGYLYDKPLEMINATHLRRVNVCNLT